MTMLTKMPLPRGPASNVVPHEKNFINRTKPENGIRRSLLPLSAVIPAVSIYFSFVVVIADFGIVPGKKSRDAERVAGSPEILFHEPEGASLARAPRRTPQSAGQAFPERLFNKGEPARPACRARKVTSSAWADILQGQPTRDAAAGTVASARR